ncbi:caspase domain-containing protein [Armillaria novae-zelandiae]|uniref:Caspase domain-containing protein n=1 Tax=Armillaria novae-zelandiae TaxID=153914 RepID=A0AA39PQD1_9AGAR|nr:caspase domain-containing protein [Armillaria novae-zelandiae]
MSSRPARSRPSNPLPPPSATTSRRIDKRVSQKALLIGIGYALEEFASGKDDQMELEGTHTDVDKFRGLLVDTMFFDKDDIVIMTDTVETSPHLWPTKTNIEREIHRFVQGASAGDIFFIFYGGHGYQIPNENSTEADKKDEHIVPCDAIGPEGFIEDKMIIDDDLKDILVMPLAVADAKLTAVFDCCHSGTVLDLSHYRCNDSTSWTKTVRRLYRYIFSDTSVIVNLSLLCLRTVNKFIAASRLSAHIKDCKGFCLVHKRNGTGYVVCISACRDEEIAWGGKKGGSLSRAIMSAMETNPKPTLEELNVSIDATVKGYARNLKERRRKEEKNLPKIVQHPQFSSLWPLDMNQRFLS